ncbi:two pore domain potassium channel family protein [Alicyclobacillus sp. SO9]|uniref:two pore domain potassium channel family protein n=1 Tax=Alicyclobacillus sp. SO9 TaxID=2665646 RepID=UPI0018E73AAA|nr:two pore domain potassium channel family protein [Alicyclobacillus sp. SO9]QQE77312.1 two pore domain potassium channel family protein [Alicyclobacillus sp. SO9]
MNAKIDWPDVVSNAQDQLNEYKKSYLAMEKLRCELQDEIRIKLGDNFDAIWSSRDEMSSRTGSVSNLLYPIRWWTIRRRHWLQQSQELLEAHFEILNRYKSRIFRLADSSKQVKSAFDTFTGYQNYADLIQFPDSSMLESIQEIYHMREEFNQVDYDIDAIHTWLTKELLDSGSQRMAIEFRLKRKIIKTIRQQLTVMAFLFIYRSLIFILALVPALILFWSYHSLVTFQTSPPKETIPSGFSFILLILNSVFMIGMLVYNAYQVIRRKNIASNLMLTIYNMFSVIIQFASDYQQLYFYAGKSKQLPPLDFFYYSALTFVGNGIIPPVSHWVKEFSIAETILGYLMASAIIALIVNSVLPIIKPAKTAETTRTDWKS